MAVDFKVMKPFPHLLETFNRTLQQVRKIHSDAQMLRQTYSEKQGLTTELPIETDGIPKASTSQWNLLTEGERLRANLTAYQTFKTLLEDILEEQKSNFTPLDTEFHNSIGSIISQVEMLIHHIEEIMLLLEVPVSPPIKSDKHRPMSLFEKKLWGYKVLLELCQWTVRSVRDFNLLKNKRKEAQHFRVDMLAIRANKRLSGTGFQ
ncbi:ciliary neurotrophic factor [Protopterus annectens]|uniref:ciliary neurotrophic factor n=1 Tax=Protopterus annectens TaxID=7888 RepID=UPI001CFBE953|nr:ciliary neurotrophic factor [Protopterus annectens]